MAHDIVIQQRVVNEDVAMPTGARLPGDSGESVVTIVGKVTPVQFGATPWVQHRAF